MRSFYMFVKSVLDFVAGFFGCFLLIPLALVIKIIYLLEGDRAPIIYTGKRIGRYGKPFQMHKFRSMVPNADELLEEMLKHPEYRNEWSQKQKLDNDPRITPFGRFLRKTSLDEFPQFINVLRGEMSLVGPRPLVEGELEKHGGLAMYNDLKPGITGWWACNGRSNLKYEDRLELEYYYIKNCSFHLDVLIILKTIGLVIRRTGAK